MINHIGDYTKNEIRQPTDTGHCFFFNPRNRIYPALIESGVTYTASQSNDYCYNSYCGKFDTASLSYQYTIPQKFLIDVFLKPNFAYSIATDCNILSDFLPNATFKIGYNATTDKLQFVITGSSGTVTLGSTAFTSTSQLQDWYRVVAYADVASDEYSFYLINIDNELLDSASSGANIGTFTPNPIISVASTPHASSNASAACYINSIKIADLTDISVSNHLAITDRYSEIVFYYNKSTTGYERIKINDKVKSFSVDYTKEKKGSMSSNRGTIALYNLDGAFSDDQYAIFSPKDDQFNGTSSQKYLQNKTPFQIHINKTSDYLFSYFGDITTTSLYVTNARCNYYSYSSAATQLGPLSVYQSRTVDEIVFTGKSDVGAFRRNSYNKYYGEVSINLIDYVVDMYQTIITLPTLYSSYNLCASTYSLFHSIAELSTKTWLKNYCFNSGFENATVANSWVAVTGNIGRSNTVTLFDSYVGLVTTSGGADIRQVIDFANIDTINISDYFTLSCFLRGVSAGSVQAKLTEYTSGGTALSGYTSATTGIVTSGWSIATLTHTITGTTASRIAIDFVYIDCGFYVDGVTLYRTKQQIPYTSKTTQDGESGLCNADISVTSGYVYIPIDAESISGTVITYYRTDAGKRVYDYINEIMDAGISRYCGISCDGILQFKNRLGGGEPVNQGTIDTPVSVNTTLGVNDINRIEARGVYTYSVANDGIVWDAVASNLFDKLSTGDILDHVITAGSYAWAGSNHDFQTIYAIYGDTDR